MNGKQRYIKQTTRRLLTPFRICDVMLGCMCNRSTTNHDWPKARHNPRDRRYRWAHLLSNLKYKLLNDEIKYLSIRYSIGFVTSSLGRRHHKICDYLITFLSPCINKSRRHGTQTAEKATSVQYVCRSWPTHVRMYACTYAHYNACIHCIYRLCRFENIHLRIFTYIHIQICMCTRSHAHARTHTHTHTCNVMMSFTCKHGRCFWVLPLPNSLY